MRKSLYSGWIRAGFDTWALGVEASTVVGLRLAKVARGGKAAEDELNLMIAEKLKAASELQIAEMTGRLEASPLAGTKKVLRHYRAKVSANCRRLG
ncbi:MAG: hypothetical protein JWO15_2467 [Sphingomonadales bacterium]|nr:hypothetical protein [Sphingomonadales bacterium]